MKDVRTALNTDGIVFAHGLYGDAEIAALNEALDPIFAAQDDRKRSYASVDDILSGGFMNRGDGHLRPSLGADEI